MQSIRFGLITACAAALMACGSPQPVLDGKRPSTQLEEGTGRAGPSSPSDSRPVAQSSVATVVLPAHLDPKSSISSERSIYFELDEFEIAKVYQPLIERHAAYLSSRPDLKIRVEGNADERGSAEYNIALGQKRSQAVLAALRVYGIKDTQVEPVSFGEERPKAGGQDESAWAQNRRADLVYPLR